jgi:anaerobic magnesium-protoporphyrin IX monomethyl ester cyclase
MKVCLVYPDIGGVEHYGARKFYHGLGYISSVLKSAGHETSLLYLQDEPTAQALLQQISALAPSVVAFSATTHQFPYVAKYARWIKEAMPAVWTMVGGAHPTLVPEEVLNEPGIDVVCVGEGEYPVLDWVAALQEGKDVTHIPNLWLHQGDQPVRNPLRPLIANLDELPFADRELFGFDQILTQNDGWVDMMAGRGCPYGCSYCCNPGLRDRFKGLGKYVRFRSVDNVLSEIRALASRYVVKTLNFQDDVFTLDRDWTLQFCQEYRQQFSFPFWINTRVERINDEEMVAALAHAGCRGVRIGIESGNESLRAEILKRRMSNDEIRQAFALANKHGLNVYTCNMLGVPGETAAMIEETIALNRELEPADLQFSVFYPYPMTELYDVCVRKGYLREGESLPTYYGRKSILHSPTLTAEELGAEYDRFQQLKDELRIKRDSPLRYHVYQALRFLGRIKMRLTGTSPRSVGGVGTPSRGVGGVDTPSRGVGGVGTSSRGPRSGSGTGAAG